MGCAEIGLLCSGRSPSSMARCSSGRRVHKTESWVTRAAQTAELGKRAFDMKVDYAVRQIRRFLAGGISGFVKLTRAARNYLYS